MYLLLILGSIYLLIIYNYFSWGYVMLKFWYWFLLPVFPTLPHIGFYPMVGLIVFITVLKTGKDTQDMELTMADRKFPVKKKLDATFITSEIFKPWITLLIGWLIKQLI